LYKTTEQEKLIIQKRHRQTATETVDPTPKVVVIAVLVVAVIVVAGVVVVVVVIVVMAPTLTWVEILRIRCR